MYDRRKINATKIMCVFLCCWHHGNGWHRLSHSYARYSQYDGQYINLVGIIGWCTATVLITSLYVFYLFFIVSLVAHSIIFTNFQKEIFSESNSSETTCIALKYTILQFFLPQFYPRNKMSLFPLFDIEYWRRYRPIDKWMKTSKVNIHLM